MKVETAPSHRYESQSSEIPIGHSQIESLQVGSSGPTHFLVVLGLAGSSKFQYSVPLMVEYRTMIR